MTTILLYWSIVVSLEPVRARRRRGSLAVRIRTFASAIIVALWLVIAVARSYWCKQIILEAQKDCPGGYAVGETGTLCVQNNGSDEGE